MAAAATSEPKTVSGCRRRKENSNCSTGFNACSISRKLRAHFIKGSGQMKLSDLFLSEFDQEMATARKTLERIPEDKLSWKPHEKSMPLDRLAGHVAELAGWPVVAI